MTDTFTCAQCGQATDNPVFAALEFCPQCRCMMANEAVRDEEAGPYVVRSLMPVFSMMDYSDQLSVALSLMASAVRSEAFNRGADFRDAARQVNDAADALKHTLAESWDDIQKMGDQALAAQQAPEEVKH